MNDIRTGRIKCLVVRDLSRFGRIAIERQEPIWNGPSADRASVCRHQGKLR